MENTLNHLLELLDMTLKTVCEHSCDENRGYYSGYYSGALFVVDEIVHRQDKTAKVIYDEIADQHCVICNRAVDGGALDPLQKR